MALVPKIDPNKIFASNAPTQDKPAAFANYEKGMDETRKNLGRPTIPQLNYLHQTADQKILWIHQNGGGLPYDASIEYAENAVTLKDGELKQLVDGAWVETKTKANAITTASAQNQQEINDFGGAEWYAKAGGYKLGATVKLANGDTVQSTKTANTANPNVDMTGWSHPNVYNGLADLLLSTPSNGSVKFVDGSQGGWFEYNASKAGINDGGTVFNGWVRIHYLTANKLSWFGATKNDPVKAVTNEPLIIKAIKLGDVIVDGEYYTSATTSNEVANSFALLSESENSTLKIIGTVNSSGWIKLGNIDYVKNDGVNIIAEDTVTGGPLFTIKDNLVAINKFDFKNFDFKARFRLFNGDWSKTVDPATAFYGIKDFNVSNISLNGTMAFISTANMQHDLITVDVSKARNISSLTYSFAVSNDHAFQASLVAKMKRAECTNSHAINDDSFFGATTTSSYYAYFMYEGSDLLYARNWVEGLKYRNTIALYDVYANCLSLTSTGNTWKNNLCMSATKLNNELMKSKGAFRSYYSANNYILEKEFVERHAVPIGGDWVTLFQKVENSDNALMSVRNCNFEIYKLLGQSSSTKTKNVEIRYNTFKLGVAAATFLNIRNFDTEATTFADASVIVCDNDFEIGEIGGITRGSDVYNTFTFLGMNYNASSPNGTYKEIRANKNRFKINKFNGNFYLASGLAAGLINLDDTTITSFDAAATTQIRPHFDITGGKFGVSAKNQVLNITAGKMDVGALSTKVSGTQASSLEFIVDSLHSANSIDIFPPTSELLVRVSISMDGQTIGMASAVYNFKLTPTGVRYTDTAGVVQTVSYPVSGGDNITINPKVFANLADSSLANIRFIFRAKDSALGVASINLSPTDVYGDRRYKSKVKVETFPI